MILDTKPAFPFFGAGQTEYFEYCEIYIRFLSAPDREARKKILALTSLPIKFYDGNFYDSILVAITPRYANRWIEENFASHEVPASKKIDLKYYASPEAKEKFEKAIIRWLGDIHTICPIEVAVRKDDSDAGRTEFSVLHYQSLPCLSDLLAHWKDLRESDFAPEEILFFVNVVENVLMYAQDRTGADYQIVRNRFMPYQTMSDLLRKKDFRKIELLIRGENHSDWYFEKLCDAFNDYVATRDFDNATVIRLLYWLIEDSRFWHFVWSHNVAKNPLILGAVISRHDNALLKRLQKLTINLDHEDLPRILTPIYLYIINSLVPTKEWHNAISLYDFIIEILGKSNVKLPDLSFYCNALWIIQNDNTGLPVDKKLNHKFLSVCELIGPQNPAVFYNAACVYNEMGDINNCFDRIKKALDYGIHGREYIGMLAEITNHKAFHEFRSRKDIRKFLKELPETKDRK